ncbi:phosphotransferase [Flavobacterium sp. LS1R47]|uniref:Phosphotransferase n=1 Tax=Flavobacterium frigoritolerans TaxID=2987686 RepID=A0A9X3C8Z3_9FLAO|nr:phosphotransferase [Flavobacterium frigoritolerans]MCV9933794.1 phosphotransferase [Flavobacterium frigoritolerans]
MQLAPESVYQYLHKRQLINEDAVVKGHFMVHPVKTRNNIMKILVQPENSLFVKQMGNDKVANSLFQREISAYNFFKNNIEFASIAAIVPKLLDHDDENNIMVTELLYNAKNLHEYYMLTKNFDLNLAREQATILSTCHIVPDTKTDTSAFPKTLPWVLQLDKFKANEFFVNNEASANIIDLIKQNQVLQNALINLAVSWQYTHFIHGDIKWINFLTTEDCDGIKQKLIDWELADIGDPMWDVAGLMQSYITVWLLGFDNNDPKNYKLPDYMQPYDIKNTQSSARTFLYKYMELQGYPESYYSSFLIRIMQFTAARIIQTSVEGITYNTKIEANNMRCIQLAFNIMKDPESLLYELFNIKVYEYV